MRNRRGQSILEYTVIVIIILAVMVTMKNYVKRGIQGRWKSATDDFGDQYDPRSVNSSIMYATQGSSQSVVTVENGSDTLGDSGQWTMRNDSSNAVETKTGSTQVGD